jgi:hypothetical protein
MRRTAEDVLTIGQAFDQAKERAADEGRKGLAHNAPAPSTPPEVREEIERRIAAGEIISAADVTRGPRVMLNSSRRLEGAADLDETQRAGRR